MSNQPSAPSIILPPPDRTGTRPLEEVIDRRRSVRDYAAAELKLSEVGQLLWAGQGGTRDGEGRSAPSAGGLHPLVLTLAAGRVNGLAPGVYRYAWEDHCLTRGPMTDVHSALAETAIEDQPWLNECAGVIAITGRAAPCLAHFGEQPPRGERALHYLYLEAGHAAQDIYLQATALDLGAVFVGAYDDAAVVRLLGLDIDNRVLGLMAVGVVQGNAD